VPRTWRSAATSCATVVSAAGQGAASALVAARTANSAMLYFARMAREAELQLLSSYENIELAERALQELCSSAQLEEEIAYWVGMALREALANAIKHGNKLNPDKRVFVRMVVRPGSALEIKVEDEGDGFDAELVADPTAPDNLLRSSGRGVFYMRQFMDEVRFQAGERGGTRIELIKRLARTSPRAPSQAGGDGDGGGRTEG
jgi:serine/threonine-protein kinase RsbW